MSLSCLCQDLTKVFARTWSKGEEEEEEDDEGEKEEDTVDEEEEEDTSAEGPSSSLDDSTEKPTEETQSPVSLLFIINLCVYSFFLLTLTCNIWSFQKPEELKEESVPDGEQKGDGGLCCDRYTETWDNKQIQFPQIVYKTYSLSIKGFQIKILSLSTAAEIAEQPDTTGEEKTDDGSKPANGTADSSSKSQSGSSKKVQELKTEEATCLDFTSVVM